MYVYVSVMPFLTDKGKNERKQKRSKNESEENEEESEVTVEIPLDDHGELSLFSL